MRCDGTVCAISFALLSFLLTIGPATTVERAGALDELCKTWVKTGDDGWHVGGVVLKRSGRRAGCCMQGG
jgi:hypothetical protein